MTDLETAEDKLSWIFTAFDSDGGGSIDYDEITDICQVSRNLIGQQKIIVNLIGQGLFRLAGIEENEDILASCVADVRFRNFINMSVCFEGIINIFNFRATIDGDGDGDISKEEFVANAMQSKFIADLLTKEQYND